MSCKNCGGKLEKSWNFCPKCGSEIVKGSFFNKLFPKVIYNPMANVGDMEKVLGELEKNQSKLGKNSFSISISFGGDKEPRVRIQPIGNQQPAKIPTRAQMQKEQKARQFSRKVEGEIKEPKTELKKMGSRFLANIHLPEISSEKDIEIRKMGESIEVRAYTKSKTYFKILKCPPTAEIISQNFEDGKLMLEYA